MGLEIHHPFTDFSAMNPQLDDNKKLVRRQALLCPRGGWTARAQGDDNKNGT